MPVLFVCLHCRDNYFLILCTAMPTDQLDTILGLVQENNKILRGMRRSARISSFIRYVYWIIIIASLVSSYYFIQPYIDQLLRVYNDLNSSAQGIKSTADKLSNPGSEVLQKLDSLLKNK